eukprot:CAMPEP_0203750150 /NCGR_PEP_ID=MMETSP0098-20131031/4429_1 /ASSEMBLY_ACC=CAM_ASM_000208 /TAXON_ID=96639 /ORGANISM=" , Strain NY0313808BC1" /LENGTH=419 /DNA_ID=CAMNT_0050639317 /DNA_START=21 /DNA_END=1277 /DNA_ORIENTATION=+
MATRTKERKVLFKNVRIFNGVDEELQTGSVVVQGRLISRVQLDSEGQFTPDENQFDQVIDGEGRVISPGFIDIHVHAMMCFNIQELLQSSAWVIGIRGAKALEMILSHGFTTIRDAGGADGSMASAVDAGLIDGPRVFPSCKVLSQTCGHGDFLSAHGVEDGDGCKCSQIHSLKNCSFVADGADSVRKCCRDNFKNTATQIKICASGGVMSPKDPLHVVQYTPEEIRAAVLEAEHFGTYVMAHAYNTESVRQAVENGVRCIEHGHMIDEETAKLCAEKGVVISTQYVIFDSFMSGADSVLGKVPQLTTDKGKLICQHLDNIGHYIRKYNIKTGFGTDCLGEILHKQNREFTLRQKQGFSNIQIMRQATSESASIIEMSGPLNKYPPFGVIKEGALADILLHEANPLDDVSVLEHPDEQI